MRASKIVQPGECDPTQMNLFAPSGQTGGDYDPFPPVLGTEDGFKKVIRDAVRDSTLGLDFEFNPKTGKPSVMGVANLSPLCAAVPWSKDLASWMMGEVVDYDIKVVGHSSISTEKTLIERNLSDVCGHLATVRYEDTLIEHYLLNQDFCKATDKEEDEGSLGFMNLWCMASMTTDLPQWKICRGRACVGPCPKHDVWGYCAIDAYASVEGHRVMQKQMKEYGVPYSLYRELIELSEICYHMEQKGLRIDLPYIDRLNAQMDEAKENLFPHEKEGKRRVYKYFNPRSAEQIISWFGERGLNFQTTEKKYIQKVLERQGVKAGHGDLTGYLEYLAANPPEDETIAQLYNLYQFKSSGKGCDPWFGEKYRQEDYIHSRFITTATCTGRLASSRPNYTNIPARGWGKAIKMAIVPHQEDEEFLEVDASQLELRIALYLAGVDPSIIGADAFNWLVAEGNGQFEKAVTYAPTMTPRDIAKSVSYGSLYGEGIKLLDDHDMDSARIKREEEAGALKIYYDWEFRGKRLAFTGSNLADRFFGNHSFDSRKKALLIQEDLYFAKFPFVRNWQQKVLRQIEDSGIIKSPVGRFLRLYGEDTDDAKMAFSFLGQGCGADHIQAIMLNYRRDLGVIPDLMVHDSLLFSIKKDWSTDRCKEFLQIMFSETFRFPGLAVPGKAKRGPNYGSLIPLA